MVSSRRKNKRARIALRVAEVEISEGAGERIALPWAETELIKPFVVDLGDGLVGPHEPGALERASAHIEYFHREAAITQGLEERWRQLMTVYTALTLALYLAEMGRPDLAELFGAVWYRRQTERHESGQGEAEPTVANVPVDQVAVLVEGPANIHDPEFRKRAPDLARLIDQALAEDPSKPQG